PFSMIRKLEAFAGMYGASWGDGTESRLRLIPSRSTARPIADLPCPPPGGPKGGYLPKRRKKRRGRKMLPRASAGSAQWSGVSVIIAWAMVYDGRPLRRAMILLCA